ncbi:MAG: metallophosphoesterase [Mycobacteriales bacterium]
MRTSGRLLAGTAALAVGGLAYSAGWERTAFTLREFTVQVLPPGAAPIRVLHLSDVHMRPGQRRKQAWIRALADRAPDLVVTTGDNLGGRAAVAPMLAALAPLLTLPGLFVLGSNDYYAPKPKNPAKYFFRQHRRVLGEPLPYADLVRGLTDAGWHDLTNRRTSVSVGGLLIDARGVDDPHLKRDRLAAVGGPAAPGAVALGLVHAPEPRVLDAFVADGVALLLAGHTHGGQLRLPGYGALVTNCGIDRARCRGLSRYGTAAGSSWLHVSAGLGTSVYAPVRFACRPEASLLTLMARPAGAEAGVR